MVKHYQKPCQESDHHKNLPQKRFLEGVFLIAVLDDWIAIFNRITYSICNREVDGWEKYYIPDTTQNIEGAVFTLWEEMLCLHTKWVENISVQWETEKYWISAFYRTNWYAIIRNGILYWKGHSASHETNVAKWKQQQSLPTILISIARK